MASHLRFGYGFDMRNPPAWHRPWADLYAETIEFIEHIEALGFEGVWLAEHHGIDDGYMPSPIVFGAGVATRTKKVRISQGVGLEPHYHPVRLAEDLAVLDILSNGRAEFAMGIGYLGFEADAYGWDRKKRGRISDEVMEIVRRLWQGETLNYQGEFFQLKGARCTPLPVQAGGIPMFVGGVDTGMLNSIMDRYVALGAAPSREAAAEAMIRDHPIGRLGRPDEMGGGVVCLCSEAASFVTCSEFVIDGGFSQV